MELKYNKWTQHFFYYVEVTFYSSSDENTIIKILPWGGTSYFVVLKYLLTDFLLVAGENTSLYWRNQATTWLWSKFMSGVRGRWTLCASGCDNLRRHKYHFHSNPPGSALPVPNPKETEKSKMVNILWRKKRVCTVELEQYGCELYSPLICGFFFNTCCKYIFSYDFLNVFSLATLL